MLKKSVFVFLGLALCLSFGVGQASAVVHIAPGGIGDLGLAPLYDVRDLEERTDNWENYVVIENTTGKWVAFHLRFRAWRKSIEVYDHIVLLSPYDVFWFTLTRALGSGETASGVFEAGDTLITSADTETLLNSGFVYPDDVVDGEVLWTEKFQDFLLIDCGFNEPDYDLKVEMQAGHFEIIGVWSLCLPDKYWTGSPKQHPEDTHNLANVVRNLYVDGANTINVYDVLEALFYEKDQFGNTVPGWACGIVRISGMGPPSQDDDNETGLDGRERWGEDCGNVLTGTVEMYDTGTGSYELENIVFLKDFRTDSFYHRDGYRGGAIVYPTSIMEWEVDYYADGVYRHPAWYVNENAMTTVGPGLRDGDDKNICCNEEGVPDFNNTWSLDDLELALAKSEIWYQYFDTTTYDGADVTTDVVLTYPTKHYHWFFKDWPYYNGQASEWDDNCSDSQYTYQRLGIECYQYSQLGCYEDCDEEAKQLLAPPYPSPGNWGAYYDCTTKSFAYDNQFTSKAAYWNAVDDYRGVNAEPSQCKTTGSIATWFLTTYKNGPISTKVTMWDMEENLPGDEPGTPPPGSPWRPTITSPDVIPHEVNIAEVGLTSGEGINEVNPVFALNLLGPYTRGHWRTLTHSGAGQRGLSDMCGWCYRNDSPCGPMGGGNTTVIIPYEGIPAYKMVNGKKIYITCSEDPISAAYMFPPIGLVMFSHTYGMDVDGITRTAMAEWHYKNSLLLVDFWPAWDAYFAK